MSDRQRRPHLRLQRPEEPEVARRRAERGEDELAARPRHHVLPARRAGHDGAKTIGGLRPMEPLGQHASDQIERADPARVATHQSSLPRLLSWGLTIVGGGPPCRPYTSNRKVAGADRSGLELSTDNGPEAAAIGWREVKACGGAGQEHRSAPGLNWCGRNALRLPGSPAPAAHCSRSLHCHARSERRRRLRALLVTLAGAAKAHSWDPAIVRPSAGEARPSHVFRPPRRSAAATMRWEARRSLKPSPKRSSGRRGVRRDRSTCRSRQSYRRRGPRSDRLNEWS